MNGFTGLKADSRKKPLYHITAVALLDVGFSFSLAETLSSCGIRPSALIVFAAGILPRLLGAIIMMRLIFAYGFGDMVNCRLHGFFVLLPCVLVAVNNTPFIALMSGKAYVSASTLTLVLYTLYVLSIGLFEELAFRGIILPLFAVMFRGGKHAAINAILASSLVFGIAHIVNLSGGAAVGEVLLQTGYNVLIGAMYAVCAVKTGGLLLPVLLHATFDFGGMLVEYLGGGEVWNIAAMIVTAAIGLFTAVWSAKIAVAIEKNDKYKRNIEQIGK